MPKLLRAPPGQDLSLPSLHPPVPPLPPRPRAGRDPSRTHTHLHAHTRVHTQATAKFNSALATKPFSSRTNDGHSDQRTFSTLQTLADPQHGEQGNNGVRPS